jgi:hypothetical protein
MRDCPYQKVGAQHIKMLRDRKESTPGAQLALCLMLFLGARRGDAIRLGPKNMGTVTAVEADGRKVDRRVMSYVPGKTDYQSAEPSVKPILAPLAQAIKNTPIGLKTFLVTSDAGFGNKMRERCDEAGLPEYSAHGLKKIGATICADLGATDRMLMAPFDWKSEKWGRERFGRHGARSRRGREQALWAG